MSALEVFTSPTGAHVRVVTIDGEPRWVLADVCTALGITNRSQAASRLDAEDVCQTDIVDSNGRTQKTTVINESGLYEVILRSDRPEARPFRKWVTSEVLPQIRRTGAYLPPTLTQQATTVTKVELARMILELDGQRSCSRTGT